jgi:hypothetical protein
MSLSLHRVQAGILGVLVTITLTLLFTAPTIHAKRQGDELSAPMIVLQARALAREDRLEGLALLEDYIAGDPRPELEPWVGVEAGEHRRLLNDTKSAREHFLRVQQSFSEHPLAEAATLGITLVDAGERPSSNQLATMGYLLAEGAPPSMDADRYRLLAMDAAASGERPAKVRSHSSKATAYAQESGDPIVLARVTKAMMSLHSAGTIPPEATAPAPMPEELAGRALERAREALLEGDLERAQAAAETFLATFPEAREVGEAEYILRRVAAGDPVDPTLVGVLLPLSGTYAPPGERLKMVIEMANRHAGSPMKLIFVDTEGDAERTVEQLEQLVLERGVVAVLGPLLKDDATAAAEVAQDLNVPLI